METNYCSRCGFLLVAVSTDASTARSPRKRGLKQGLFLFLLTFLVAPLMGMISMALDVEPIAVGVAVIICFIGGLLRMVYALMFESAEPGAPTLEEKVLAGTTSRPNALPPQNAVPAAQYFAPSTGIWRDTNDLQPTSVTENTTKLLEKDEAPQ